MKIWILTSKFGQGHFSVAQALKEELIHQGHEVIVDDIIEVMYPSLFKVIYYFFNNVICRNSGIYNFINSFGCNPKDDVKDNNRIKEEFENIKPDQVITTWSACARLLGDIDVPIYTCVTDIGVHKGWMSSNISRYFVACDQSKNTLVKYGIDPDKVNVNGIPLKRCYYTESPKPFYGKNILVMGGGLGIIQWVDELLCDLKEHPEIKVTVITGKNKKLYTRLKNTYPEVKVVGYTNKVKKYMSRADLILSKPGGVSLFESIFCETPFIAIHPEYQHERVNADFIMDKSIGEVVFKEESISEEVLNIFNNKEKLIGMKRNIRKLKWEIKACEGEGIFMRMRNVV